MTKLLLIIPLVLSLISCSAREIDYEQIQDKDGIFYAVDENKPYSGKVTGFYPNGQLKGDGVLVNGKLDGLIRDWYENGLLSAEVTYVDGKLDGVNRRWYENGQ